MRDIAHLGVVVVQPLLQRRCVRPQLAGGDGREELRGVQADTRLGGGRGRVRGRGRLRGTVKVRVRGSVRVRVRVRVRARIKVRVMVMAGVGARLVVVQPVSDVSQARLEWLGLGLGSGC